MATEKKLTVTSLEDGTLKIETGDLSGTEHKSAEDFIKLLSTMLGGEMQKEKLPHSHTHTRTHQHKSH